MFTKSLRLGAQRTPAIGLDIGHDSIKMVQLALDGRHPRVIAASKADLGLQPTDDVETRRRFIALTLKEMLAKGKFRGRHVVSCVPNDKLRVTSLRVTEPDPELLEQSLQEEAARRFGLNPRDDSIRFMLAGSVLQGDETKSEVILFATDNDTIKHHIALLEEAALRPIAIETAPCALYRCFSRLMRRQEDRERTAVFVDVGDRLTTVVFSRSDRICFVKQILIGAGQFDQRIADKLGVEPTEARRLRLKRQAEGCAPAGESQVGSPLDASARQTVVDEVSGVCELLARELSLCLRYYTVTFRGKRVQRAVIAGGGANEPILLDVLKRHLPLQIETAEPFHGFDLEATALPGSRKAAFSEWAISVGLALKGYPQQRMFGPPRNGQPTAALQGVSR